MKKIKIGLLARIVIAIILGIAIGTVFPAPLVRIFVTFNGIFSEFLNFSIPSSDWLLWLLPTSEKAQEKCYS